MSRGRVPRSRRDWRSSRAPRLELPPTPPRERCACGREHEQVTIDIEPGFRLGTVGCPVCSHEPRNVEELRALVQTIRAQAAQRMLRR